MRDNLQDFSGAAGGGGGSYRGADGGAEGGAGADGRASAGAGGQNHLGRRLQVGSHAAAGAACRAVGRLALWLVHARVAPLTGAVLSRVGRAAAEGRVQLVEAALGPVARDRDKYALLLEGHGRIPGVDC